MLKGANLLPPLGMGVISSMEFFVRGGNSREHAKPSTLLHRPTEHELGHLRNGSLEVFQ